jgi:hypothetical protein
MASVTIAQKQGCQPFSGTPLDRNSSDFLAVIINSFG